MTPDVSKSSATWLSGCAAVAGALSAVTGAAVLAGWFLDVAALKSVLPGAIPMKANTAFCFVLAGLALWWLSKTLAGNRALARQASLTCATVVTLAGSVTLVEAFSGWDLGVDGLLFRKLPGAVTAANPGGMATTTALNFLLLGAALLLLNGSQRWARAAQWLALTAGLFGFAALLAYGYGVEAVTSGQHHGMPMALSSAAIFVIFSAGVLCLRPDCGVTALLAGDQAGSVLARRLLPVTLIVMPLLGWLRLRGEQANLYSAEYGIGLMVGASVLILSAVVAWNARSLNQAEAERRRAEERIQQFTAELQRSNRELEHFAYVSSHDLQEPLRTVASFSQLLAARYHGKLDQDADEFIQFIVDGAKRMQTLINDLLFYSRIGTRGKPFEPVDLTHELRGVLSDLDFAIGDSGAVVSHDPLPVVTGDDGQLRQLLQNLVGNALKFRRPGEPPQVRISAARNGSEWRFDVRDNGIGIDPQYFERVFIIFQRLHGRDDYPGTGIGLAVCKRIVERHGGRIWVDSEPGRGSTFHFTLPAEHASHDQRRTTA